MDYDLAVQLKDAGFPQQGGGVFVHDCRSNASGNDHYCGSAYAPTLRELIDACGNELAMIIVAEDECSALEQYDWDKDCVWGQKGLGSTPRAAVARLWLALYSSRASSIDHPREFGASEFSNNA